MSRDEGHVKVQGFDIIRFNEKNNFKAWQMDCKDILVSLDQIDVLDVYLRLKEISAEGFGKQKALGELVV